MYGDILKKIGATALIALVAWLAISFLFPFALPFMLAWAVAACLQPAVRIMSRRLGIGNRPISAVFVTVTVIGVGTLAFLLISRFVSELGGFLTALSENADGGIGAFIDRLKGFTEKLPFLSAIGDDVSEGIQSALKNILAEITASIPNVVGRILGALPGIFIFAVVLIMSSYYFVADFDAIKERIYRSLPPVLQRRWDAFKSRLWGAGTQYLKACVALAFITFAELLVGFLVLEIPYAFTLAVVIALVDMLPILGAGTVLIPWALWEWVTGDGYYAVGLIIIFCVVSVVRRFAEPRIISSGIGLSPVTTLVSMYIGFRLYGLGGLFLAPLFAVLILSALPDNISEALGMKFTAAQSGNKRKTKRKNTGAVP